MKRLYFLLAFLFAQVAFSNLVGRWDNDDEDDDHKKDNDNDHCKADNCARAVTGTRPGKEPPVSVRRADCSSFMLITVIPATTTVTKTATQTATITEPLLAKRNQPGPVTVSPTAVPSYAAKCSGPERYSSVCSCWGITAHTTTAPTPTTTITKTITVTASVCPPKASQCPDGCHNLMTSKNNCGACGKKCPEGVECEDGKCEVKKQKGQCQNPVTCGPNNACGEDKSCFCHLDTKDVSYCHPNALCKDLKTCYDNDDCTKGSVCVENCCGKTCRVVQQECENPGHHDAKSRLFRKRDGEKWTDGTP